MSVRIFASIVAASLLVACSKPAPEHKYSVDIRWTSYGIPHVLAEDFGSLGYGFAYAASTDGICVFARELATAMGTLSADAGATEENITSDIFYRSVVTEERLTRIRAKMPPQMVEYGEGFAAGYNRYLRDHAGKLPASCNDEPWVRPIEATDVERMFIAFGVRYGLGNFTDAIRAAAPPGEPVATVTLDVDPLPGLGSNAISAGSSVTETGRGLLLGNPHYPWHGPARFHVIHTTIPGVLDVMGARLLAGHFIAIGFNKDIAWTHTVSTALRFTVHELELNPDNPMQYRYGDEFRDIEAKTVNVPGSGDHTIYMSHHGPLATSAVLPWTNERAYAVRDALADNDMALATYAAMQGAESVADIEAAISQQGVFFVNTIAADRDGNAFYADISSTPNVDAEMLGRCQQAIENLPSYLIVLKGSDPDCEWKLDERSTVPGNMPADDMPRATSTEYFTNSNDSYWLSNPDRPLEGYSPVIGTERTARSLRTRAGLTFVDEILGSGGKLSSENVQDMLFSHRHFSGELFLDEVLTICVDGGDDIKASCDVLANWDKTANTDSRGTHIWTEFWERARRIPNLHTVDFDADDAVNTPNGLALDNDEVRSALRAALATAQKKLTDAGLALDARWGDVQFAERNGERIGIPGAVGRHGVFSYIVTGFTEEKGYTPIHHGNSYIQVIGWDEDGNLDARGLLTYSQSPEPESPHYSDQTELYSRGEWIDFPFTEEEIQADPNLRVLTLQE